MKSSVDSLLRRQRRRALSDEKRHRLSGQWSPWEKLTFPKGSVSSTGWPYEITEAWRNRVFAVLERPFAIDGDPVTHLAISSLSGRRPSFHEMHRIKDELAGEDATAIEVYPSRSSLVDGSDMFHLWVLPGPLPFGLHMKANREGVDERADQVA